MNADKLLNTLHIKLNEEQETYLKAHMKEKRTILAKKLGISKLQLNQLLLNMMPSIEEAQRKISAKMRGKKNARKAG